MAYYDDYVKDPQSALEAVAERRGISAEAFARQVDFIASEAQKGVHLTLGEAESFYSGDASPTISTHVDSCPYCQAMLEGLNPAKLVPDIDKLRTRLAESQRHGPFAGLVSLYRSTLLSKALVGLFFAVLGTSAVIVAANSFRYHGQMAALQLQLRDVIAKNDAVLAATQTNTNVNKQLLAALPVTATARPQYRLTGFHDPDNPGKLFEVCALQGGNCSTILEANDWGVLLEKTGKKIPASKAKPDAVEPKEEPAH
jgi:hypothetical protein